MQTSKDSTDYPILISNFKVYKILLSEVLCPLNVITIVILLTDILPT